MNLRARRHDAHLGVIGQFSSTATRPLGEIAFRVGLKPPGDLANEIGPVSGAAGLFAEFLVAIDEFTCGHPLQGVDLAFDGRGHVSAPFGMETRP